MPEHLSFTLLFVGALVLGGGLSLIQHRAYTQAVRKIAAEHNVPGLALVSGRGKGLVKGIALLLVVKRGSGEIVAAHKMQGASIFARFKPTEEFSGTLFELRDATEDKKLKKAFSECITQLRSMPATGTKKLSNGSA